jgi:multicomponent Na+:H+ antiporter subunit D
VSTHTDYISQMAGIGKRMPLTMGAFTVASLGMAGIPLLAGFVSKYYMLIGGIRMGAELTPVAYYLVGALLLSGVLNIAYFWPVIYTAFFEAEDAHDAKPLVDFRLGGEPRSIVAATDGGRANDDAATDGGRAGDEDESDDEESADDLNDIVAEADGADDSSSGAADGVDESEVPDADESEVPDADLDDLPTDEEGVVRPDFAASERDFSEPAERVDTGDYAVDRRPSDADVPFGVGRADEGDATSADAVEGDSDAAEARGPDDPHGDHDADTHGGHDADTHDDGHHGGPPPGGWEYIAGLDALRGRESTWFTLGPILASMTLAVLLGVIPYEMGFLELIELIVDTRLPEEVVRP